MYINIIGQDISLNIILDDDNSLDTMYHTKNVSIKIPI